MPLRSDLDKPYPSGEEMPQLSYDDHSFTCQLSHDEVVALKNGQTTLPGAIPARRGRGGSSHGSIARINHGAANTVNPSASVDLVIRSIEAAKLTPPVQAALVQVTWRFITNAMEFAIILEMERG